MGIFRRTGNTSYSHLTTETSIAAEHLKRWSKKSGFSHLSSPHHDRDCVEQYLESIGRREFIGEFKIEQNLRKTEEGMHVVIRHRPLEKFRVCLPLSQSFVLAEHGYTDKEQQAVWKTLYVAVGNELGLNFDCACVDVSRLLYLPACPDKACKVGTDSPFRADANIEGRRFIDYRDYQAKVPETQLAGEFDASPAVETEIFLAEKQDKTKTTITQKALKKFAAQYGKTFQLATLLEDRGVSHGSSDNGVFVPCPFDDHTGQDGGTRTLAWNGGGEDGHQFGVKCQGEACADRDRLDYIARWMSQSVITADDLRNQDYGGGGTQDLKKNAHFVWENAPPLLQATAALPSVVKAAETMFVQNGTTVMLVKDRATGLASTRPLKDADVQHLLDRVTAWQRMPTDDGKTRFIGAPPLIAAHVHRLCHELFPLLTRIADAPFYTADGQLVIEPGYHSDSRTFYAPHTTLSVEPPSAVPTRQEVADAVALIDEVISDFPFDRIAGRAHVFAMLFQPFVRAMIAGATPAYLIDKPSPGTGAGLLADVISIITTGEDAPIESEKHTPDEWRKTIFASLLSGRSLIVIDNIHKTIEDASIAAAITAQSINDRILGISRTARVENRATWIFTGNNVELSEEMIRRCLLVKLDAKMMDPHVGRRHRHPLLKLYVRENRNRLVHAVLTIIQAWIAAGLPKGGDTLVLRV